MNIDGVLRPLSESALAALEASPPCPVRPTTDRLLKSVGISSLEWRRWLYHSAADHALRWQRLKAGWSDYLTTYLRSHPRLGPYQVARALGCGVSAVRYAKARMHTRRLKKPGVRKGAGLRLMTEAQEEACLWFETYMQRIECARAPELPLTGWRIFRKRIGAARASHFCSNYRPDLLARYNAATDHFWQQVLYYRMHHSQQQTAHHFEVAHASILRRWRVLLAGGTVHQLRLEDGVLACTDTPMHRRLVRPPQMSVSEYMSSNQAGG